MKTVSRSHSPALSRQPMTILPASGSTCCIDETDEQELQGSVCLIFQWYVAAVKCYVYMSDVSAHKQEHTTIDVELEGSLDGSRWSMRGWTLQELLGPKSGRGLLMREAAPRQQRHTKES